MDVDVLVFGGGSVGLWLIDELRRQGRSCLLVERHGLGSGQTISSQGIIHGGLKYTLTGQLTGSAQQIRDMPGRWLNSLQGQQEPDLSKVQLRGSFCHLWRTESLTSQLGMIGAKFGLRITPEKIEAHEVPPFLDTSKSQILKLPETVISPRSFIKVLRDRNLPTLLKLSPQGTQEFLRDKHGKLWGARLTEPGQELFLQAGTIVFTAGRGNENLRNEAGFDNSMMQRRPLHMLMLKGDLPDFCGHCVDGAKTRVTITSQRISNKECVWQVGGHLAEVGVKLSPKELVEFGSSELKAVMPHGRWDGVKASTYFVDRAEGLTTMGTRPEQPIILEEENVITCWPTKLALVPVAVDQIIKRIQHGRPNFQTPNAGELSDLNDWPKPEVALEPWETSQEWYSLHGHNKLINKAA